jgi:hypothetical protein
VRHGLQGYTNLVDSIIMDVSSVAVEENDPNISDV